jgi:hypothetical protein
VSGSSARLVVVWAAASIAFPAGRPASVLKKFSNSRRAKASRPQINGGCAGVVGAVPASGFRTQLTTLDTTLTAAVNRFGAATGAGAAVVAAVICAVWAAIIGETFTGPTAASVRASANTATFSASRLVDAASGSD